MNTGSLMTQNLSELTAEQMLMVLESAFDGIYITDGNANTLLVNKSYETITGLHREALIGQNMRVLVENHIISQSASLKVLESGMPVTLEQEFSTGKRALVSSTPIRDAHGAITMVVTNVRDITALLKLQEQVKQNRELVRKYCMEMEEMRVQLMDSSELVAHDEQMLELLRLAKRVAKVDATVLILGETGAGKEEVAKFIHKNSARNGKSFIKINCGAIPENLIESELFGYEKGAFTGAHKDGKMGLFEVADGGTLFLDEVAELPTELQVRLLRVLQEKEITRVGGTRPIRVDVRILAATNRDLESLVKQRQFREDLYYRLHVVPIHLPALRERREDILPLIQHFLKELNSRYGWNKSFTREALLRLYEYSWPGNVRELKNIIERVVVMSDDEVIDLTELVGLTGLEPAQDPRSEQDLLVPMKTAVERLESQLIQAAFARYGNVRDAAKALGIDASTLVRKRQRGCQE